METWKDIIGYEGVYQINDKGQVRSVDRAQISSAGSLIHYKGKLIKAMPNSSGYLRVALKKGGKEKRFFVHRLVALHFVDNPKPELNNIVNHLDCNYLNNTATNLEWTTLKGNSQHASQKGRLNRTKEWVEHLKKGLEWTTRAVEAYDLNTGEIKERFAKLTECRAKGYMPSSVCSCCKGKRKHHKGLGWRYVSDNEK